jgi:hypothetical protein
VSDEVRDRSTYKSSSVKLGRNSFILTTLSTFFAAKLIERSRSHAGSKGSTAVIYCTSLSAVTPNEHSVKKVASARVVLRNVRL